MRILKFNISFLLLIVFSSISCKQTNSLDKLNCVRTTDTKNKFTVNIPEKWDFEFIEDEWSSTIIFSDTLRGLDSFIIFSVMWDSSHIYLNNHFKNSMDSIASASGQEVINQTFSTTNEFNMYCFNTSVFDTLNQINLYQTHYYLKQEDKDGNLKFTITRADSISNKADSEMTSTILKSIKRNE